MFEDVEKNRKKRRSLLFDRESACLQDLLFALATADRFAAALWAFDCMEATLLHWSALCPQQSPVPANTVALCRRWARGEIKMPAARSAIFTCHALAKQQANPCCSALCHAVGQGCSTLHTKKHAPGLVFYELSALALEAPKEYPFAVKAKIAFYTERLHFWLAHSEEAKKAGPWAAFLLKDSGAAERA